MVGSVIRFAHRGAPVQGGQGNTLAAFEAALRDGAEGLESDIRLTADGVPVLVHGTGALRGPQGRRLYRSELPSQVPSLAELWQRCGNQFELSLDMADPVAAAAVIDLAHHYGAAPRLWLTYWRLPTLAAWRRRWPEIKLVYATFQVVPDPLLRRVLRHSAAAGVDALNAHQRLISRRTSEVTHAAGLKLFVWGARQHKDFRRAVTLGVDAVFVDSLLPPA